ncbi:hypothetical protein [Chelatococcus sambhunathii]|nr:hypothetical protein [Chelatococcus sambhunathii]
MFSFSDMNDKSVPESWRFVRRTGILFICTKPLLDEEHGCRTSTI